MLKFIKEESKKKKVIYKIFVKGGYGDSIGNIIDAVGGKEIQEPWIKVERKHHDWKIIDDSMTVKKGNWIVDATDLGFAGWDDEVISHDHNSDESQCFGMSSRLSWNGVMMTPDGFHASSIEELCEALEHVCICSWCPGDI